MCGRKTLTKDIASIIEEMNIQEWEENNYKPSYNVAPTDFSLVPAPPVAVRWISQTCSNHHLPEVKFDV